MMIIIIIIKEEKEEGLLKINTNVNKKNMKFK